MYGHLNHAGGGFQPSEGDWPCPNPGCTNVNFARRKQCNRCGTAQPGAEDFEEEASKSLMPPAPGGPPGLFKAGDWACTMCGNVNWERRNECNICKTQKAGLKPEDERDGVGGGFNERQERVASTRAEVADDGYDDFGQKKKKVRASKAEREAAALARLQNNYRSIVHNPAVEDAVEAKTVSHSQSSETYNRTEANEKMQQESYSGERKKSLSNEKNQSYDKSQKRRSRSRSPAGNRRMRSRSPYRDQRRSRSRDRNDHSQNHNAGRREDRNGRRNDYRRRN